MSTAYTQLKTAIVEQENPSKIPVLLKGDLTPTVMREYEQACLGYFDTRDVKPNKQVRKILAGFRDTRIQDWIAIHCDCFLTLSFKDFMTEFRKGYLPEDWEAITRIKLLGMTQGDMSFWDFTVAVQAKNSLLQNTPSYLGAEQLRYRIESGMATKLALRYHLKKNPLIEKFEDWLIEVKHVDDLIRLERKDFEERTRAAHDTSRRNNNNFSDPPCRGGNVPPIPVSNPTVAPTNARIILPKLTQVERTLLFDNEGCLKCHKVFINHRSTECQNSFPEAAGY
jgi:hypothetical protein